MPLNNLPPSTRSVGDGTTPPDGSPPTIQQPQAANGWGDYRMFVLDRLQVLFQQMAAMDDRVRRLEQRWAIMAGIWLATQALITLWLALRGSGTPEP